MLAWKLGFRVGMGMLAWKSFAQFTILGLAQSLDPLEGDIYIYRGVNRGIQSLGLEKLCAGPVSRLFWLLLT